MEWLMATGALAGPWRLSPWLELGAGAIGHPGDCPLLVTAATSTGSSLGCGTSFSLGAAVATGLRFRATGRLLIGLEGSFVAATAHMERRYTTKRLAVNIRLE